MKKITQQEMSTLEYSYIDIVVVFKQKQNNNSLFYEPCIISTYCAMLKYDENHVVPCYKIIDKMANGVEIPIYKYATLKAPRAYGTYELIPRAINKKLINKFFNIDSYTYMFEGFFSNKFKAEREFNKYLLKEIQHLSLHDKFVDDIVINKLQTAIKLVFS